MAAPCTILVLLCLMFLVSTFVLSLDILPGDVNKPYKVDPVQVLNETEGKNLHITCKCSSCVELRFLFDSTVLIAYFRRYENQMRNGTLPDYSKRVQVYHDNDNYTVVISNLTVQDQGKYFCISAAFSEQLHVNIKEVEDSDYGLTKKEPFTSENMTGNSMEQSVTIQPIGFPKRPYNHTAASSSSVDDLTNDRKIAEAESPTTHASSTPPSASAKTITVEDMLDYDAKDSQASLSVTSASLKTTTVEDTSDHGAEDSQASLSVTSASLKTTTVEDMSDYGPGDSQASLSVTSTSYRSRTRLDQNRNPTPSPPLHSSSPPEHETDYSKMRPDASSPKLDHHVREASLSVAFTSSSSDFGSGGSGDASPISPELLNPSSTSTETESRSGDLDDELTSSIPSGSTSNDKHTSSASSNRNMTQDDLQDITSQAKNSKIPTNSSQKYVLTTGMSTPKVFKNHEVEDSPATPSSKLGSTRGKDVAPVDEEDVNKESSPMTTDSQVPSDSSKKELLKPSTSQSRRFKTSGSTKDSTSPSPSKQKPKAGTDGVFVDKDKSDEEATPVTSSIETEVIGYVGVIIAGTITMMLVISLLVIKLWLKQHEEYV